MVLNTFLSKDHILEASCKKGFTPSVTYFIL